MAYLPGILVVTLLDLIRVLLGREVDPAWGLALDLEEVLPETGWALGMEKAHLDLKVVLDLEVARLEMEGLDMREDHREMEEALNMEEVLPEMCGAILNTMGIIQDRIATILRLFLQFPNPRLIP